LSYRPWGWDNVSCSIGLKCIGTMTEINNTAGFIRKTTDRVRFVSEMMSRYAGLIEGAGRVFVKPNIVSHEPYPTTTHPEVLDTVLGALAGKDVLVGDGPAGNILLFTERTLRAHSLYRVCESREVRMVDLHSTSSDTYQSPRGFSVGLSSVLFEYDLIISLPVLKAHPVCTMTGALKNQFGFTTKAERIMVHSGMKNLHKCVAEINAIRTPELFIMDAVETLVRANEVRWFGVKKTLGYMLAGTDPVALDARGLKLLGSVHKKFLGKTYEDVSHLAYASEYGVGAVDDQLEEI